MQEQIISDRFSFLTRKQMTLLLHLTVWLILFILPAYLLYVDSDYETFSLRRSIGQILVYAMLFYSNYLWLTPTFLLKGKLTAYFSIAILLVLSSILLNTYLFDIPKKPLNTPPREVQFQPRFQPIPGIPMKPGEFDKPGHRKPSKNWPLYNFIITSLFISGFGAGLGFSDKLRKNEKEKKEAEKAKLNTELAFLKNQINPHFFFNTLNNIYSLVQTDVSDGQKAILQLSKLMRYLLYETEKGDNPLSREIEFMNTYIDLMKLRISEKVTLMVNFPDKFKDIDIPPLLFLPFIENAFKYGISYRNPSFISIELKTEEGVIRFSCLNSLNQAGLGESKPDSGIGLENVKKRLALLFPDRHTLQIHETESVYNVQLEIRFPKQ